MQKGDVRAVENPISAIFDLAEDVESRAPRIRVTIQYARTFIAFGLILNGLIIVLLAGAPLVALLMTILVFLLMYLRRWTPEGVGRTVLLLLAVVAGVIDVLAFRATVLLGLVLVPFYFLGLVALGLLREVHDFFDYYALRHRILKSVRDADPVAVIPPGRDATQRILTFLGSRSPELQTLLRTPGATAVPAMLRGLSGMMYQFDAYLQHRPAGLGGLLGFGSPGFAVFVKSFAAPPTATDLQAIKRAVEDISAATSVPPARVIAVWRAEGDARLSDEAYELVTKEVVRTTRLGTVFSCSLESISETTDGTYDFIPYVTEIAGAAALPQAG
ncbi:MAG TPA: hypothetical protein VI915_02815 [Thermoplasmata archaeon]|nr:hypothetical protein [Thermoplasmata archaeon]